MPIFAKIHTKTLSQPRDPQTNSNGGEEKIIYVLSFKNHVFLSKSEKYSQIFIRSQNFKNRSNFDLKISYFGFLTQKTANYRKMINIYFVDLFKLYKIYFYHFYISLRFTPQKSEIPKIKTFFFFENFSVFQIFDPENGAI